jgi:flagellar biosynthetic protein FlhB
VLLGAAELAVQYIARMQRLRMTRRQVQEEQRELAADPRLLSERRSRAAQAPQLAAADLSQLKAAALVITGAGCVVAVEYTPEHGVPRVWLSAQGTLALELLSRAYNLDLPILSDELLASALAPLPLRAAVPAEFHKRVALHLALRGVRATAEAQ